MIIVCDKFELSVLVETLFEIIFICNRLSFSYK